MSAYSGRYYRGASRDRKAQKRTEAEARQAKSMQRAINAMLAFGEAARAVGGVFKDAFAKI